MKLLYSAFFSRSLSQTSFTLFKFHCPNRVWRNCLGRVGRMNGSVVSAFVQFLVVSGTQVIDYSIIQPAPDSFTETPVRLPLQIKAEVSDRGLPKPVSCLFPALANRESRDSLSFSTWHACCTLRVAIGQRSA